MSTAASALLIERRGDVTHLTLNRAERGNSLSDGLVAALDGALDAAGRDGTRLLIIAGAGKNFCTGFDLDGLEHESDASLLARFVRIELLLQRVHGAPYTTLAVAQGRATGAGADLFAACEERWIIGAARFAFPGAAFGLVLGTARLAARVGATTARRWVTSGASVDADEALRSGLAGACFPSLPDDSVAALAARARRLDPLTQAAIHAATHGGTQGGTQGHHAAAQDLYDLVRSAARPGLQQRISTYVASQSKT